MNIIKTTLPEASILNQSTFDYVDSFSGTYLDMENEITSADIGKAFFTASPKWIGALFELRNRIVSLFGLKTSGKPNNRQALLDSFQCAPDERLGLFKVYHRDENEVILGEDDKHLNFRVSVFKAGDETDKISKTLTVSTIVQYNNWFGKLYFFPVKPFHQLIVPSMVKSVIQAIEGKENEQRPVL